MVLDYAYFLNIHLRLIIDNNKHTSIYVKNDDFGFPIVNFPCLRCDVPRLPLYDIY